MATVTYIKETRQHLSAMRAVMNYCMRKDKTWDEQLQRYLISGINCDGLNSILEFEATKAAHGKMDGINFYQYVQSFSHTEIITPKQAHEIAMEFAVRAWPGAEVLVTTHCDANHVHSHFIINSVNFETGRKLRQDPNTLKFLRLVSDDICQAHGFSVLPQYKSGGKKMSAREYRAAQKGESWKFRLMYDIGDAMKKSCSREDFILLMKRKGYEVKWTEERKDITFTCPNGKNAGEAACTRNNTGRRILKMNSDYESNSQKTAFWDRLIAANGQATEVREQVPYQPVIYAIPEEWRLAEKALLEEAVKFQPELYQLIRQRATLQELQQMQEQQLYIIQTKLREQTDAIRSTLQQDGSVREQNFSRTSDLLSENRKDILQLVQRLENRIKKIVICTAVSSVTLSVLVCMALQHWAG